MLAERGELYRKTDAYSASRSLAAQPQPRTRQLSAILDCRRAENGEALDGWVFPSRISRSGRVADLSHMYEAISRTFESHAEVAGCLAFSRLCADDVEIVVDAPVMANYASWA